MELLRGHRKVKQTGLLDFWFKTSLLFQMYLWTPLREKAFSLRWLKGEYFKPSRYATLSECFNWYLLELLTRDTVIFSSASRDMCTHGCQFSMEMCQHRYSWQEPVSHTHSWLTFRPPSLFYLLDHPSKSKCTHTMVQRKQVQRGVILSLK